MTKQEKRKTYYEDNKDACKERMRKRREKLIAENPSFLIWQKSKTNAKIRGIEFTITPEDIVIPTHCPVFGCKLEFGGDRNTSPSIDRKDSSKGYISGNIAIISFRANIVKNSGTIEEHEKIALWMRETIRENNGRPNIN